MFTLLLLLPFLTLVSAHGYVSEVLINSKSYKANPIGQTSKDSIIRSVTSQDPMYGADNNGLACGPGSKPAKSMASINPGDEISFAWNGADGSYWPHEMGPMITYMGYCGVGGKKDCSEVDANSVKWFKIDEVGVKDNGRWYLEDLMSGKKAKVTIPNDLKAGNYLIRHEIIALHIADSYYGAEFYAGCAQLKVGGSEQDVPTDDELLSFPGSYTNDDPGIFVPNIFNGNNKDYPFPGGRVAKLVSSGSSNDDDSTPTSTSSSAASSPTKATGDIYTGGGTCRLKNKKRSMKRSPYFPKRHSRIMRDLVSSHHS